MELKSASEESEADVAKISPDIADQIKMLAKLRDQGILAEEDFVAKRASLLARLPIG